MPLKNIDALCPGNYYHIYNRAVGAEKLFHDDMDYGQFLQKWRKYIAPFAECFAYCLMPNHFHFLIRLKHPMEIENENLGEGETCAFFDKSFRSFFTSYAKSFNFKYKRKGKLFMLPFRRVEADSDTYLTQLIYYIHRNPIHHDYVSSPDAWEHSSYNTLVGSFPTWISREAVLKWFGGKANFIRAHKGLFLIRDDFDALHRSM